MGKVARHPATPSLPGRLLPRGRPAGRGWWSCVERGTDRLRAASKATHTGGPVNHRHRRVPHSNPPSSLPDRLPLCDRWCTGPRVGLHSGNGGSRPPQCVLTVGPSGPPGGARRGDRSPGAAWSPAPMESVDRWPLAIPGTQIPGGSRPVVPAVRRRDRGVRTPHQRAVCRSP
jgi:hypothetical protein